MPAGSNFFPGKNPILYFINSIKKGLERRLNFKDHIFAKKC